MTEEKTWDEIPSLSLELDDADEAEETDERRSPRTERPGLMRLIPNHMDLPVKIVTNNRGEIEGKILNLGRGGIKLNAAQMLDKGLQVQVEFTLNEKKIAAPAEVCWVSPQANGCDAGLKFSNLPANIGDYLDSLHTALLLDRTGKLNLPSRKDRT